MAKTLHLAFEKGRSYTRAEILASLGGGVGYLPMNGEQVVAGLFAPNDNAVTHLSGAIDVYPKVLSKGAKKLDKEQAIPVFLQFSQKDWRYAGEYRLRKTEKGAKVLEQAEAEMGRKVVAVLHFEPA